jgi:surfactin synthase thioesterase subunit
MNATTGGSWFQPAGARTDAPWRLFLFPHGGGSAAPYVRWSALLPPEVELVLVQLPGRHDRAAETPFTELVPLLDELRAELGGELDGRPYAFFGHSLGAMLAYRLTLMLEDDGEQPPALLGVSSWAPLRSRDGVQELSGLDDAELVAVARELDLLPEAIAASPDMLRFVLPALRADLSVYADYGEPAGKTVSCPLVAYGANDDPLLQPNAMTAWAEGRSRHFLGVSSYPGGHFYLDEHAISVAADLTRHLHREFRARAAA